ncbi:hypothetical protein [Devosia nitrariae]|uniref:Glycosyl transferase family 90 n=1 Tax=Devosia nitrariae TaxID=2071872 RepID=A0ABQ5W0X2_9HYPH|nr:hypothetical protein [Devosia nitrariae]GLQ53720.1 hypothetical protein GCM10010862_09790 [Devosia nitrariae]
MGVAGPETIDVVIDLPIYLLQTLRMAQAIGEAGFRICVDPEDTKAVVRLKEVFGFDYRVGKAGAKWVTGLYIDHLGPVTRIGSIERPLIVPKAILNHCRDRWPAVRQHDASFAGLLTTTRRSAINQWLSLSQLEEMSLAEPTFIEKQLNKWAHRLHLPIEERRGTKNVIIRTSDIGRHFPTKSWNSKYYDLMLNSKFVLCPSGDFKANGVAWTYRFFEGAMCGTIPIVEETCPPYEGYKFRLMSEPVSALQWSQQDAEHNFALAREQMTVETERLRAEVLRLLAEPDAVRKQERHGAEIYTT